MVDSLGAAGPSVPRPPIASEGIKPPADPKVPGGLFDAASDVPPTGPDAQTNNKPALQPGPPRASFSIAAASVRLSSLALGNQTDIAAIARVVQELNLTNRTAAREQRAASRDADLQAQQAAANKVREQAAFAFAATIVSSSIAIAGSAIALAGTAKAQAEMNKPDAQVTTPSTQTTAPETQVTTPATQITTPTTQLTTPNPQVTTTNAQVTIPDAAPKPPDIQIKLTAAKMISDKFNAISQGTTEFGKIAGAGLNLGASFMDAQKMEEQANSTKARTLAEDETDFIRAYTENIQTVLQKLAAIEEAKADINKTIVRA